MNMDSEGPSSKRIRRIGARGKTIQNDSQSYIILTVFNTVKLFCEMISHFVGHCNCYMVSSAINKTENVSCNKKTKQKRKADRLNKLLEKANETIKELRNKVDDRAKRDKEMVGYKELEKSYETRINKLKTDLDEITLKHTSTNAEFLEKLEEQKKSMRQQEYFYMEKIHELKENSNDLEETQEELDKSWITQKGLERKNTLLQNMNNTLQIQKEDLVKELEMTKAKLQLLEVEGASCKEEKNGVREELTLTKNKLEEVEKELKTSLENEQALYCRHDSMLEDKIILKSLLCHYTERHGLPENFHDLDIEQFGKPEQLSVKMTEKLLQEESKSTGETGEMYKEEMGFVSYDVADLMKQEEDDKKEGKPTEKITEKFTPGRRFPSRKRDKGSRSDNFRRGKYNSRSPKYSRRDNRRSPGHNNYNGNRGRNNYRFCNFRDVGCDGGRNDSISNNSWEPFHKRGDGDSPFHKRGGRDSFRNKRDGNRRFDDGGEPRLTRKDSSDGAQSKETTSLITKNIADASCCSEDSGSCSSKQDSPSPRHNANMTLNKDAPEFIPLDAEKSRKPAVH